MKRFIVMIAYKGLLATSEKNGTDLKEWPYSIASIFGHGGRVMLTLENITDASTFLNYLATGNQNKEAVIISERKAASHAMKYLPQEERYIEEKLGITGTGRNLYYGLKGKHLGIDIAFGGIGSPLNNNTIWVKGNSVDPQGNITNLYLGHLYIFLNDYGTPLPNDETRSGLLIGLEQSGPSKKNAWGRSHTVMSGFHDSSVLRGVTGGNKWEKLNVLFKPNNVGGKVLNLTLSDYTIIDKYIQQILSMPEETQKRYFWYILNSTPRNARKIFAQ